MLRNVLRSLTPLLGVQPRQTEATLIPPASDLLPLRVRRAVTNAVANRTQNSLDQHFIAEWSQLDPEEIKDRIDSYDPDLLAALHCHEATTEHRPSVLRVIDNRLAIVNGE